MGFKLRVYLDSEKTNTLGDVTFGTVSHVLFWVASAVTPSPAFYGFHSDGIAVGFWAQAIKRKKAKKGILLYKYHRRRSSLYCQL